MYAEAPSRVTDYAFQFNVHIEAGGGVNHCDIGHVNHKINTCPMSLLNYDSAIETVRHELGKLAM